MEKKITDELIEEFLYEYMDIYKRKEEGFSKSKILENLLTGDQDYAFTKQTAYEDPDCLEVNIRNSVRKYERDKDAAIRVYKFFLEFLQKKGISAEVHFPPIPVSNTFERLMFIAKFIHDSEHNTDTLPALLWQSKETIEKNLKKLRGKDKDPIQICGKVFKLTEKKRSKKRIDLESTAHPLFLTPNLTQVIVMLKGLKAMSEDPDYAKYAETIAADIWEQLSDYAKDRIHYVLTDLLPEDLTWYESLEKQDKNLFYPERTCSVPDNVLIDSIKNNKRFFVETKDGEKYSNCSECRYISATEVNFLSDQGEKTIPRENILRSAYTPEELL